MYFLKIYYLSKISKLQSDTFIVLRVMQRLLAVECKKPLTDAALWRSGEWQVSCFNQIYTGYIS